MVKKSQDHPLQHLPVSIVFPVILSLLLFILAIFLLILPSLEDKLIADRRLTIRNLTEVAWSTLNLYQTKEKSGELTRQEAQDLAIEHFRKVRYGDALKDYFWINDMHPNMIMHPYRTDLEGMDVSKFTDPKGNLLFAEVVKTVRAHQAGYVHYEWQWKDEPDRIVPKLSYVKGFEPWGWIVGTGLYVNDIQAEIDDLTKTLTLVSLGALLILSLLSLFVIRQSIRVEKGRRRAEKQAQLQQEQLFHASKMVSVGTLVAGVAHEVNNPATSIMLNAPLLRKVWEGLLPIVDKQATENPRFRISGMGVEDLRDRIPLLLDHIEDGARRIKNIVADLKDFSRTKPPEMDDEINLNHSARRAIGLLSNLIRKSTLHFAVDYRIDLPVIIGNEQKLEQVIVNLLVNACQALNSKKDRISLKTGFDEKAGTVFLEVEDSGSGIEFDLLDRIRDPFFTTKQDNGNTGLGLAISDRIVQDHGGKLQFSSFPGEGTCARIVVPVPLKKK